MTSKIKVDNIENQCGGAVVTKCGGTTTITGSVVKANNIQAADGGNLVNQCGTTITLGASGDTINLASGASQSGFGRTGTVDWNTTPKTATFTAVSGDGFFANTTGSAFNMNLPAGSVGAIVSVADYAATWQTNALTVVPNGTDKIGGVNANVSLSTQGQSVTFVYVDSTQGWINTMDSTSNVRGASFITATGGTPTQDGDYEIRTFTGPGTFCISALSNNPANNVIDYLIVAGGASGGHRNPGNANGGGGAGGFRYSAGTFTAAGPGAPRAAPAGIPVSVQGYPIVVGGGGAATPGPDPSGVVGNDGSPSSGFSLTSTGGGGGGGGSQPPAICVGRPGGSGGGGGGGRGTPFGGSAGGSGNTPPVSPSQGSNGGLGGNTSPDQPSAGGGGAMAVGSPAAGQTPNGPGGAGAGIPTAFGANGVPCGSYRYYAGGGAGGTSASYDGGTGGIGGGGGNSTAGTTNTGGGGGGGNATTSAGGGAGGSGIVIIRYKFQ
jgi:hypothetical protein